MKLERFTPPLGDFPALATYICERCGHVLTVRIEEKDEDD